METHDWYQMLAYQDQVQVDDSGWDQQAVWAEDNIGQRDQCGLVWASEYIELAKAVTASGQ